MGGKFDLKPMLRVFKGVMAAAAVTIVSMVLLTGFVVLYGLDDGAIRIVNQVIKAFSLLAGVYIAVGRGGEKGLLTGSAIGILYILIGYALYSAIDGSAAGAKVMAIEEAAGAAIGAAAGVALANMKAGKRARAYNR